MAADIPMKAPVYKAEVAPAYNWTGWYVGGNVGYGWGNSDTVTNAQCGPLPQYFICGNVPVVQTSGTGSLSPKGWTGGVQAGYNLQAGHLVYGAEVDFGAFNLKSSRTVTSAYVVGVPGVPFATSTSIETDWLLTARGRMGWTASPGVLLYATGGLALTSIKVANAFADAVPIFPASGAGSNSEVKAGWTLGGGIEWMVAHNWTVKAEYLYVDFGRVSSVMNVCIPAVCALSVSPVTTSSDLTANIARLGLNYKLGGL